MIKPTTLLLVLSMLSPQAQANTWLCAADYMASITDKDGVVTGSTAGQYDKRYMVNERGVFAFGDVDEPFLDECRWYGNQPVSCERSGFDQDGGHFSMTDRNVFTLTYSTEADDGERLFVVVKGKCSTFSD